jgi:MFS family permease
MWRRPVLAGSNLAVVGMGLGMRGPSSYLPTYLQSVQGLGAIAAGMVLASMSLGWPAASALSGRLYMRIGFRDTALIGAVLMLVASSAFLLMPRPQPVSAVVLDQVVLGAGFGLLSTALLVGVQSTVGWERRGVVTGANMFSRYLGQSLGAALFGAVFNAAVAERLAGAPAAIAGRLPQGVNDVIGALNDSATGAPAKAYLRDAIELATRHLFVGMALISALAFLVLLVVPRHFPELPQQGVEPGRGHPDRAEVEG